MIPEKLKRLAPVAILLAGGAVAAWLLPQVPHDQSVDLALDETAEITGVEVAWYERKGTEKSEAAVQGCTWHFQPGSAPSKLRLPAHLPNGTYNLDGIVERGRTREAFHRVIPLDDGKQVTVRIR